LVPVLLRGEIRHTDDEDEWSNRGACIREDEKDVRSMGGGVIEEPGNDARISLLPWNTELLPVQHCPRSQRSNFRSSTGNGVYLLLLPNTSTPSLHHSHYHLLVLTILQRHLYSSTPFFYNIAAYRYPDSRALPIPLAKMQALLALALALGVQATALELRADCSIAGGITTVLRT
jgi:hypothetical protein